MLSEKHRASQTAEPGHSDLEIYTSQNAKGSFGLGLDKTFENFNLRTMAHCLAFSDCEARNHYEIEFFFTSLPGNFL